MSSTALTSTLAEDLRVAQSQSGKEECCPEELLVSGELFSCPICLSWLRAPVYALRCCLHVACLTCLFGWVEARHSCPHCRAPATRDSLQRQVAVERLVEAARRDHQSVRNTLHSEAAVSAANNLFWPDDDHNNNNTNNNNSSNNSNGNGRTNANGNADPLSNAPVDEALVAGLLAMGFNVNSARQALRVSSGSIDMAVNWLLERNNDSDLHDTVRAPAAAVVAPPPGKAAGKIPKNPRSPEDAQSSAPGAVKRLRGEGSESEDKRTAKIDFEQHVLEAFKKMKLKVLSRRAIQRYIEMGGMKLPPLWKEQVNRALDDLANRGTLTKAKQSFILNGGYEIDAEVDGADPVFVPQSNNNNNNGNNNNNNNNGTLL